MSEQDYEISLQGGLKAYDLACYFQQGEKEDQQDYSGAIKAMEELVVQSGVPLLARLYCMDIKSADIWAFENVVLENGTPLDCYMFARDVDQANVAALYSRAEDLGFDNLEDSQKEIFESIHEKAVARESDDDGPGM
jgi:hypothetical protein